MCSISKPRICILCTGNIVRYTPHVGFFGVCTSGVSILLAFCFSVVGSCIGQLEVQSLTWGARLSHKPIYERVGDGVSGRRYMQRETNIFVVFGANNILRITQKLNSKFPIRLALQSYHWR